MNLVQRLLSLDSCSVSDALDKLGLPPAVSGLKALSTVRRIAGPIITVRLGPGEPEGGSKQHLCTAAIERASCGDLLVVANNGRLDCASWGGVLSAGASLAGVAGVVIDGAARDIDEARNLDFPIYAAASTAVTARGRSFEQEFNCPVQIRSVEVRPGDYAIADSSGVAFIPERSALEIIETAEKICHRERLMVQELRQGKSIKEVMGMDYENLLNKNH